MNYFAIVSKYHNGTRIERRNVFSNKRKAQQWATNQCVVIRANEEEINWLVTTEKEIVLGGLLTKGGYTWRRLSKQTIELINTTKS